ncbi:MAG: amidohydrolase family protein [Pirellulales bacterium]|nr:amidohydrolase family protein [Pirellulales bacterium]
MIDVFNHILPAEFVAAIERWAIRLPLMFERARQIPAMSVLDARLRVMDEFPGYRQILSLSSPTIETLAPAQRGVDLARAGNDALAKLVEDRPDRFPGFIASLPMDSPEEAVREANRAVSNLGAVGVQIYTSVHGRPLDRPETLEIFGALAELKRPVWLHPIKAMSAADYPEETVSKYDLWWAFGWPHETSVAMGRLVFAGIFDRWPDLAVITHHVGGTIPLFAGRIDSGLSRLGTRNPPEHTSAVTTELKEPPLTAFRRFFADTASFGSRAALECGRDFFGVNKLLFATDMPFDPEQGPGYIRDTLRAIDDMQLAEPDRDAILEDNIRNLLWLGA